MIAASIAWIVVLVRAPRQVLATGTLSVAFLGALVLAAIAIVPGMLLLEGSARGAGLDKGGFEWSLHPARLMELAWPMSFGTQLSDGWSAKIDGQETDIFISDGLFRAVSIGPGRHEIAYLYRTPGLRAGATISFVGWLAWTGLMIWCRAPIQADRSGAGIHSDIYS